VNLTTELFTSRFQRIHQIDGLRITSVFPPIEHFVPKLRDLNLSPVRFKAAKAVKCYVEKKHTL